MSDSTKKASNITVDQMIGNMTADLQNSDGQYIQLGFTPPSTPNEPHIWSEYTPPTQIQPNPFVPHYSARPDNRNYNLEPNSRYVQQNVGYNNYIAPNPIYVPEMPNNGYEKHLNLHGGKIVYCPTQTQPYLVQNQSYLPVFNENRDHQMFVNSEMTNLHNLNPPAPNEPLYMGQTHPEVLKNKLLMQPQPNRTHLIENLVGNWTSNQNGTYSPFGNLPTQNPQNFFIQDDHPIIPEPLVEPQDRIHADFAPKPPFTKPIKKQKQIAEVKPMRPTYSDVLTKPVAPPQQQQQQSTPKLERFEAKNKNPTQANSKKSQKFPKISPRQSYESAKNAEKSHESKPNLSRKWVSLDDVNEFNGASDFLKSDLNVDGGNFNGAKLGRKKKMMDSGKSDGVANAKSPVKKTFHDNSSLGCQWTENEDYNTENSKTDDKNTNKNPIKKAKEIRTNSGRQSRFNDRSSSEKPPASSKRNQRARRKDNHSQLGLVWRNVQHYISRWSKVVFAFIMWLLHLISDIFFMSVHLGRDFGKALWDSILLNSKSFTHSAMILMRRVKIFTKIAGYIDKTFGETRWAFWNRGKSEQRRSSKSDAATKWSTSGLEHNIPMPATGEEAMKRLLACKGKDPYSILGVRHDCTDDDIKRYYKRQAFLVHPDKNPQPGAEEAFKILVHAFDIIGEPERRQSYDRKVAESHQVEQAWSELNDLLSQLHQKMEYAANTIRCTNCTKRHRRISVDRPCYAARMCAQCRIHHSAKEGDIWAEASYFGFLWHYYACMDGGVYDITEWAGCQRKNLKHLRPNSHNVQYRIVLGKQGGQPGGGGGGGGTPAGPHGRRHGKNGSGGSASEREADLESFLNNLYSQSDLSASTGNGATPPAEGGGANAARSRKKNKRKK